MPISPSAAVSITLHPLKPLEAIAFFKAKTLLTSEDYYALLDDLKATAFTVAKVAKMDILNDIFQAVTGAITEGETQKDFGARLGDIMTAKGWEGLEPWHQETILRNNAQTSYSVGRFRQLETKKDRFYGEYDTVEDMRRTDLCAQLDGKVFPMDHPFWDTWWPQNHHRCRTQVRPVHKYEVEGRGLTVETKDPTGTVIDVVDEKTGEVKEVTLRPPEGWDHNPAKTPYKPDLGKYPKELKEKYEKDKKNSQ